MVRSPSVPMSGNLYLSTSIENFANTWGPAWVIHDSHDQDTILEVRIRCGTTVPCQHNVDVHPPLLPGERLAHWSSNAQEQSPFSNNSDNDTEDTVIAPRICDTDHGLNQAMVPPFRKCDRLLIGALSNHTPKLKRRSCPCTPISIKNRLQEAGLLHYLGTSKACRVVDARQISVVGGYHFAAGAHLMVRTDPGRSLKQAYLDLWQNEVGRRHPGELENFWGLLVSGCTMNAYRVRVVDLLGTGSMHNYLRSHKWNDLGCRDKFFEAISGKTPFALSKLWDTHSDWHKDLGEALFSCLKILSKTGFDAHRKELSVLWMPAGEQTERRVSLRSEEHRWVNILKEEQDSMSMAVLLEESLESKRSHSRRCGRTDQRTVLETAICINESIGGSMQLVKANAESEPHSWREPDRIWNWVWDVRGIRKGTPFRMACGSRMLTLRPLTNKHLLLEWDLV